MPAKRAPAKPAPARPVAAKRAPARGASAKPPAAKRPAAKPAKTAAAKPRKAAAATSEMAMALPATMRLATVAERRQLGKQARKVRPRSAIGPFAPPADRADPVALLAAQETSRVQALLPLRHSRMSASAFAFYRGGAAIMAADLGALPSSGLVTQLCGDAHLSNFGVFAGPDRALLFDVNDFDETHPGPFEWDVLRLAASFVLAGRDRGFTAAVIADAAQTVAQSYRTQMLAYSRMSDLDIWYDRIDFDTLMTWAREQGIGRAKTLDRAAAKARSRTSWSAISKMTAVDDAHRKFLNLPPLLMPIGLDDRAATLALLATIIDDYRQSLPLDRQHLLLQYHGIDVAHKVVGVGSVGMLAFVVLMEGRDSTDLMVLQAKQAVASVLEPYTAPSAFPTSGQRVVAGQQLMQAASDIFLGWVGGQTRNDFYIRQLRDMKYAPDPATFTTTMLHSYAIVTGRTLARAHARGGDAVAMAAYMGQNDRFDRAVLDFALSYADVVAEDYAKYQAAIADGRVSLGNRAEEANYSLVVDPASGVDVVTGSPAPGEPPSS